MTNNNLISFTFHITQSFPSVSIREDFDRKTVECWTKAGGKNVVVCVPIKGIDTDLTEAIHRTSQVLQEVITGKSAMDMTYIGFLYL